MKSKRRKQSVHTLPAEIIFEVLSRLPVDSLLRCRSVCKSWRSLISDPNFVKYHLTLSTRNNHYAHHRLFFATGQRVILKTCRLHDVLYDSSVRAIKLDYPFKRPGDLVWIVGSCNGLLCITTTEEEDTLFIWNPSTRKYNRIQFDSEGHAFLLHYGFGYVEATDDYKVVVIIVKLIEGRKYETFVKIYTLRSGIWKNAGAFPHGMLTEIFATFSNGALHWSSNEDGGWKIISLDLATETYGEVLQPKYDEGDKVLSLGSLRECLCVCCYYPRIRLDLWVMKVYGVKDSWTKLISIPYLTNPKKDRFWTPLCISDDGKVLLPLGLSKLIVYDFKNDSFTKKRNFDNCFEASTYVESLVSPMPAATLGDDRNL